MIIQGLLDILSQWIAGPVALIPLLPGSFSDALNVIAGGAGMLSSYVANFGVIIPWSIFNSLVQVWVGALVFYVAMQGLRLVLWALGR